MRPFVYHPPTNRVVFGAGVSRTELESEVLRIEARRVLLVVAESERDLAEPLVEPLQSVLASRFNAVRPHVPSDMVDDVVALARAVDADAVVSIGGGSTTGTAKAVALHTSLPIVAIPTTYAGSEMTPVWGITTDGRKVTGRSLKVLPRTVLYDPDLTTSLPVPITVSSAINALAHCVEALWAPGANPVTSVTSVEAISAIANWLPVVAADPRHEEGRARLLYASFLAGTAFATAGSGLHHKICHVLGGAFDLPHAETHTVMLPHVTAFIEPAAGDLLRGATAALGADTVAAGVRRLVAEVGAPTTLSELGLTAGRMETVLELLVATDLQAGPRAPTEADLRRILTDALAGKVSSEGETFIAGAA